MKHLLMIVTILLVAQSARANDMQTRMAFEFELAMLAMKDRAVPVCPPSCECGCSETGICTCKTKPKVEVADEPMLCKIGACGGGASLGGRGVFRSFSRVSYSAPTYSYSMPTYSYAPAPQWQPAPTYYYPAPQSYQTQSPVYYSPQALQLGSCASGACR